MRRSALLLPDVVSADASYASSLGIAMMFDPDGPELPSLPVSGRYRTVAWVAHAHAAIDQLAALAPAIVVLDLRCSASRETPAALRARLPGASLVVVASSHECDALQRMLEPDGRSLVTSDATRVGLVRALDACLARGAGRALASGRARTRSVAIARPAGSREIGGATIAYMLDEARADGWRSRMVALPEGADSVDPASVEALADADVVVFAGDAAEPERVASIARALRIDASRQLLASQCGGALYLAHLGVLSGRAVATDRPTRPLVERLGIEASDQSFVADLGVASAGGPLAAPYLAAWILWRTAGRDAAAQALAAVAPVGQRHDYAARILAALAPCVAGAPSWSPDAPRTAMA